MIKLIIALAITLLATLYFNLTSWTYIGSIAISSYLLTLLVTYISALAVIAAVVASDDKLYTHFIEVAKKKFEKN